MASSFFVMWSDNLIAVCHAIDLPEFIEILFEAPSFGKKPLK